MSAPPELHRIGFWTALALVMGNMIGSGVFLLPTSLAPYGWNAAFGWAATISGSLCLAYVLAQLSRAMPGAGGPHGFVAAAFGPLPAFLVGWSYIISIWVAVAAIAVAAVSYLSAFAPAIATVGGLPAALAVGLVWLLTLVNLGGVRSAGGFQIASVVLKLLPLLGVAWLAAHQLAGGVEPATPYAPGEFSLSAVGATAALTLWAMLGFESACVPQDKIDRPDVTIPRATLIGTLAVGIIYVAVSSAVIVLMPATEVAKSNAPFADAVAAYWGQGPALAIALFAAISAIGALNGWILLQGEYPLAMARRGDFLPLFARMNATGTPVQGLVVSSVLVSVLVLSNYTRSLANLFTFMALLSTAATLILYFACAAAALRLMVTGKIARTATFMVVATAGVGYAIWTFTSAGLEPTGWALVLLAAGLPLYALVRRQKAPVPVE